MDGATHLILHNVVSVAAILTCFFIILIVFINDHRKIANVTLILTAAAAAIYLLSNMLGASVADPELSRRIFTWNFSVMFICIFNFHCVMAVLKREREKRWLIRFVYAVGIFLSIFYLILPDSFLSISAPQFYFPNYYVPGQFYWVMIAIFMVLLPLYFIYELVRAYRQESNPVERNRIIYLAVALFAGWGLGSIMTLPDYGIQADPIFGLLFPIAFVVPFTYAILRYELLDIRIIAKKAFLYTLAVLGVGGLIVAFNVSNQWLQQIYPGFPFWVAPLISAIVVVISAVLIWRQLREGDLMKYEFITIVTHKFRTPLTHIRWAAENLSELQLSAKGVEQVNEIQNANMKLVELTDILVKASETETGFYGYKMEQLNLSKIVREVLHSLRQSVTVKKIKLIENFPEAIYISGDLIRLRFVIQTIIENAVHYTPSAGTIMISIIRDDDRALFSVKDSGIGLSASELSLVFSKFYRSAAAKLMDTEGMGIGLHISRMIIAHHRGKIWMESRGLNRGATVSFSLPITK